MGDCLELQMCYIRCSFFIIKVKFMRLFSSEEKNCMKTPQLLGSVNPSNKKAMGECSSLVSSENVVQHSSSLDMVCSIP